MATRLYVALPALLLLIGCPAGDDDDTVSDDDTAGDDDTATVAELTLEAYGTFECMGIVVDLPAEYGPDDISVMTAFIDDNGWDLIQPPVRVGDEAYFATSAFGLQPGTEYSFRVEAPDLGHVEVM